MYLCLNVKGYVYIVSIGGTARSKALEHLPYFQILMLTGSLSSDLRFVSLSLSPSLNLSIVLM